MNVVFKAKQKYQVKKLNGLFCYNKSIPPLPQNPPDLVVEGMSEYMMIVNALRDASQMSGNTGKALQIQGICDMVEEFAGASRDIFRREMVHNRAIVEGAHRMWTLKQRVTAFRYLEDKATYEELSEMDTYFLDLYYVYHATYEEDKFHAFIDRMVMVQPHPHDQMALDLAQMDMDHAYSMHEEEAYDDYMNEPYGDHSDDYDW